MAKFQKGHPRLGGRKKGQTRKAHVKRVEEALLEAGIHPITEILRLLPTLKEIEQVRTLLELQRYLQAPASATAAKPLDPEEEAIRELEDEELRELALAPPA